MPPRIVGRHDRAGSPSAAPLPPLDPLTLAHDSGLSSDANRTAAVMMSFPSSPARWIRDNLMSGGLESFPELPTQNLLTVR